MAIQQTLNIFISLLHLESPSNTYMIFQNSGFKAAVFSMKPFPLRTAMGTYLLLVLMLLVSSSWALKHNFAVSQDARTLIAPIGQPYGFLKGGCFGFEVFDFKLEVGHRHRKNMQPQMNEKQLEIVRSVDAGFLLKRFPSESAFTKYEEEHLNDPSHCIYDSFRSLEDDPIFDEDDDSVEYSMVGETTGAADNGIFLPIRWANSTWTKSTASIMYTFKENEAGLYFLMYQVCAKKKPVPKFAEIRTTFEIDFHYLNKDNLGMDSYLTAGEMPLPVVNLYFFLSYLLCTVIWILNIKGIEKGREGCFEPAGARPIVFTIHHIMSLLLFFKTLTVLLESVRYHYIRVTGHAELWSVAYYITSFFKSVFLFTVVLLIGSGWSFLKPFLTDREKCVICFVLVLQVLDNIALVVLASEAEGESVYDDWSAILHMLDIMCCCAVLVPIVWQVSTLEKSLENTSGEVSEDSDDKEVPPNVDEQDRIENEKTLAKLKLFRQFYLIVVAYIYFTRIAIYLFATMLDYRHTWVRYLISELATLAFYVIMGLQFRPMSENPYLALSKREEGSEEHVFEREMELGEQSWGASKAK